MTSMTTRTARRAASMSRAGMGARTLRPSPPSPPPTRRVTTSPRPRPTPRSSGTSLAPTCHTSCGWRRCTTLHSPRSTATPPTTRMTAPSPSSSSPSRTRCTAPRIPPPRPTQSAASSLPLPPPPPPAARGTIPPPCRAQSPRPARRWPTSQYGATPQPFGLSSKPLSPSLRPTRGLGWKPDPACPPPPCPPQPQRSPRRSKRTSGSTATFGPPPLASNRRCPT
mmetsp:Transcript_71581/g.125984  ORF Transcript_71581/g.125984 Transcript_71581/m.125984 type:complete len:224 (-) Transcript_71581:4001-4672(-)